MSFDDAKVVLLAFKLLLHNPFLWKERKINSFIALIVLLVIASLVVRYLPFKRMDFPTTGVDNITISPQKEEQIYDLSGKKVTSIENGRIYIINGKKVISTTH